MTRSEWTSISSLISNLSNEDIKESKPEKKNPDPDSEHEKCRICGKRGSVEYRDPYGNFLYLLPFPMCNTCRNDWFMQQRFGRGCFPRRYATKGFGDFVITPDNETVFKECRAYADNLDEAFASGRNLLLIGAPGTGKTHLAVAIAHVVAEMGTKSVFYALARDIADDVRATWVKNSTSFPREVLDKYDSIDFLIIDEITVDAKPFVAEHLYAIIDRRYRNEKPTVFISNFSQEFFEKAVTEPGFGRIKEKCQTVYFTGIRDWRMSDCAHSSDPKEREIALQHRWKETDLKSPSD